jgi:hypothetical protein
MERKLATIQQIEKLEPIQGADKIVKATMKNLGWECVVKKDEFKEDDYVCYCEVDSVMPEKPEYEFLRERKFRVRTIKLKKQVSQGLILPLLSLPLPGGALGKYSVGDDVTELLGITKYLSPSEREEIEREERRIANQKNRLKKFMMRYSWFRRLFLSRTQKSSFPYWVSKTDEERIQNIPHVLEQFKDKMVYVTEKIDYQSVTFTGKMIPKYTGLLGKIFPVKKYQFVVCSRNLVNNDKNSLYWKIAKKYNIEDVLRQNPTLTIQGEQGDTNIQGNKYGLKEPRLWVFNIIDHERSYHYNHNEISNFCFENNLDMVPLWHVGKLSELGSTVQELVEFGKGKSVLADVPREGIVVRCIENGQKLLSFKSISPEFLLKYE